MIVMTLIAPHWHEKLLLTGAVGTACAWRESRTFPVARHEHILVGAVGRRQSRFFGFLRRRGDLVYIGESFFPIGCERLGAKPGQRHALGDGGNYFPGFPTVAAKSGWLSFSFSRDDGGTILVVSALDP